MILIVALAVAGMLALISIFGVLNSLTASVSEPAATQQVVDAPVGELEEDPTPPMEDLGSYKLVEDGDDSWHTVELAVTLTNSTDEMQDYDVYYALLDSDGVRVLTGYGMVTDVKPGQTVKEKLMTELKSAKGLTAEVIRVDRYTQEW